MQPSAPPTTIFPVARHHTLLGDPGHGSRIPPFVQPQDADLAPDLRSDRDPFSQNLFSQTVQPVVHKWMLELSTLCRDLKGQKLKDLDFQAKLEELYRKADLPELLKLLDFERVGLGRARYCTAVQMIDPHRRLAELRGGDVGQMRPQVTDAVIGGVTRAPSRRSGAMR